MSCYIIILVLTICCDAFAGGASFEELVNGANEKYGEIETLSANIVKVTRIDGKEYNEEWNYYFKNPDMMKIEYLKPHERSLVLNKDSLIEYIPEAKKAKYADLSVLEEGDREEFISTAFSRVIIFGLRLGEVMKGDAKISEVELDGRKAYLIDSDKPDYQIWIDVETKALLKQASYDEKGALTYYTKGEDFKMFDGRFLLPKRISAVLSDNEKETVILNYDMVLYKLKVNEDIPDDVFKLQLPDYVDIVK
ncbi:outer membrane lipoprotein carrier protein LolA [Thermodesulfobacteriota bacterium]